MTHLVTWNMQGGTGSNENKWNTHVKSLLQNYQIVCLQEAGSLPSTVVDIPPPAWNSPVPPASLTTRYARWNLGTSSRPDYAYILWAQTDPAGNRVNIAICSKTAPTGLLYAKEGLAAGRPSMGMEVSGENYYSLHALASGGGDAVGLINNIKANDPSWFAMGDYNRDPTSWITPAGVICPPNKATHQGGNKLDYMVKSAGAAQTGQVQEGGSWSDHFYVAYVI